VPVTYPDYNSACVSHQFRLFVLHASLFHDLTAQIIFGAEHRLWDSSLSKFVHVHFIL
jgi:hypothetical protein